MTSAAIPSEFAASLPRILEGDDPMLAMPEGHTRCEQCRMTFIVKNYDGFGEVSACAVPKCKRRYWAYGTQDPRTGGNMVVVGVFPDSPVPEGNVTELPKAVAE